MRLFFCGGRRELVVDAIIEKRIEEVIADEQLAKLANELSAAQAQVCEAMISKEELERLLDFADWLLERVAAI